MRKKVEKSTITRLSQKRLKKVVNFLSLETPSDTSGKTGICIGECQAMSGQKVWQMATKSGIRGVHIDGATE